MQHCENLPIHPRTGLRALAVMSNGRVVWPILGGAPDEYVAPETQEALDAIVQERIARDRRSRPTPPAPDNGGLTPDEVTRLREADRNWQEAQSEQARAARAKEIEDAKKAGRTEGEQVWKPAVLQSVLGREATAFGLAKPEYLGLVDTSGIDLPAGKGELDDAGKALLKQRLEARKTANPELFTEPANGGSGGGGGNGTRPRPDAGQGGRPGSTDARGEEGRRRAQARTEAGRGAMFRRAGDSTANKKD